MSSFQMIALSYEPFAPLFALSDEELHVQGMARVRATKKPSFPCRVSLADAEIGDELLLLSYEHQPAQSPYRASGPIYIRRDAQPAALPVDVLTPYVTTRLISLRAYDAAHCIVSANVHEGSAVAGEIQQQFENAEVAYIHLHNARRGCFFGRVNRA